MTDRIEWALEDLRHDDPGAYAALLQYAFALLDSGMTELSVREFLEDSLIVMGYL